MVSHSVKLEVVNKTGKYQKSTFALNAIFEREKIGLTAERFAEFVGIPYPTLRDIEVGRSHGSVKTKQKIADALKTTVDELNTPKTHKSEPRITGSKTEVIGRLVELLPTLHESQLRFILDGIEQMHDPLIDALVEKHSKRKGQQA